MGAWGTAITSDDTVSDVVGTVVDHLKAGADMAAACALALKGHESALADPDDGPSVWLALAHVQWKYDRVDPTVLGHVRDDMASGRSLALWKDNPALLKRRTQALHAFLEKISTTNPKPSAWPRTVIRRAPFAEGDCLAVLTSNGLYTAAIVIAADNSRAEYGKNLIGSLDYLSDKQPASSDFEARKWLYKHHGNWNGKQELAWYLPSGLRSAMKRIAVVGKTTIRRSDPKDSSTLAGWKSLGGQILLCRGA